MLFLSSGGRFYFPLCVYITIFHNKQGLLYNQKALHVIFFKKALGSRFRSATLMIK